MLTLRRAMLAPGWKKQYHVGVRASQSRKLVAFISAIPVNLRIRDKTVMCSEVNFLCVHKKLRGKRLAPLLIKEVTRISNLDGIWQGLYTAGIVLPKPVSTCRYFHRSINWQKLNDCGFSPLPAGSKPAYQIRKYALPENTSTKGLRPMTEKDLDGVLSLLKRYLGRFDMAPEFTKEEAHHWFLPKPKVEQVIWSYVVEVKNSHSSLPSYHADCALGQRQENHRLLLLFLRRVLNHQQREAQRPACRLPLLLRLRDGPAEAI